jgi:hypothetical protein
VEKPRFPVFQRFYGPVEGPSEAWAVRTLGYEGQPTPARHLAAFVDEVASGVETIAVTPAVAHLAAGWRATHKALAVGVPSDLLRPRDILAAAAHALSLGVELGIDIFPPGPPADARQDALAERWLRFQSTLPAGAGGSMSRFQPLLDAFDLFPLRFVSASYLEEGRARPFQPAALHAGASPPPGRNPTLVLSPSEDWSGGDHLLLALVGSRREPYWVVAATLTDAVAARADLLDRLDRMASVLLEHDAHGGFLHPLGDLVWSNAAMVSTWVTAGRAPIPSARPVTTGPRRVDLERLAGHEHFVDGVSLVPACVNWLGRAYLRHVTEARVAAFNECDENRLLGPGRRRLTLGDPRQGATPALVERQWAMRRALHLEPAAPPVMPTPSAEEIRHRLEAEQRARAAAIRSPSVAPTSAADVRRGFSVRTATTAADAAMGLRFAVKECSFDAFGLTALGQDASAQRLAWAGIGFLVARQMPPDPPYERIPFLDVVPQNGPPLRILPATRVNYANLPGGVAPIAIENLRRLGRLVLERAPSATADQETRAFLQGRPPLAFAGMNQFTAYDSRY